MDPEAINHNKARRMHVPQWAAMGAAIGAAIGVSLNGIPVGVGLGVFFGIVTAWIARRYI
jgi:hypothetical protein